MNKKAFTLIELLVVVLIVGILAAIALPRYQKAVERSRAAEAVQILKYMHNQGELCELEKGNCAALPNADLGIELGADFTCQYNTGNEEICCNKHWCYANNGGSWGGTCVFYNPTYPIARRVDDIPSDLDDIESIYQLEYHDKNCTYPGHIVCSGDCDAFKGDGQPID